MSDHADRQFAAFNWVINRVWDAAHEAGLKYEDLTMTVLEAHPVRGYAAILESAVSDCAEPVWEMSLSPEEVDVLADIQEELNVLVKRVQENIRANQTSLQVAHPSVDLNGYEPWQTECCSPACGPEGHVSGCPSPAMLEEERRAIIEGNGGKDGH